MKKIIILIILLISASFCQAQKNDTFKNGLSGTYQKKLRTDKGKRLFEMLIHETGIESKFGQVILIQVKEFMNKKGTGNPDTTIIYGCYNISKNRLEMITTLSGKKYRKSLPLSKRNGDLFFVDVKYSEVKNSDREVEELLEAFYEFTFAEAIKKMPRRSNNYTNMFKIGYSNMAGDKNRLEFSMPYDSDEDWSEFFKPRNLKVTYKIHGPESNHKNFIFKRFEQALIYNKHGDWKNNPYQVPTYKYFPNLETIEVLSSDHEPLYLIDVKTMEISIIDQSKVKALENERIEKIEYKQNLEKRHLINSLYKYDGDAAEFEESLEGKSFVLYSPHYSLSESTWSTVVFQNSTMKISDRYGSRTLPVQFHNFFPEFYYYDPNTFELNKYTVAKSEYGSLIALVDITNSRPWVYALMKEIQDSEIAIHQKNFIELKSRLFANEENIVFNPSNQPFGISSAAAENSFFDRMCIEIFYGRFDNVKELEYEMARKPNSVLTALGQEYNFYNFFEAFHNIYLNAYSGRFSGEIKNSSLVKFSLTETETNGYGIVQSSNTTNYNIHMEPRFEAKYREYQDKIHTQGYSRYHINRAIDFMGIYDFGDIELRQLNENIYRYSMDLPPAKTLADIK